MASILFTVFTTSEDPPRDMVAFQREKAQSRGVLSGIEEITGFMARMPRIMLKLGAVQFFSWFAFFTMWSFATPALTEHVFQAPLPAEGAEDFVALNAAYNEAANAVSSAMGMYGLSSMAFALLLTVWTSNRRIDRRLVHLLSLVLGGVGFLTMFQWGPENAGNLKWSFALVGLAWGSILSMPYAMLSGAIPADRMGVGMGVFNMFIVIPQIVAALGGINWAYKTLLGQEVIHTMILAGLSLVLAGLLNLMIRPSDMSIQED